MTSSNRLTMPLDETPFATVAASSILKDHQRHRLRPRVGNRERAAPNAQRGGNLRRTAMQQQQRPSRRFPAYFQLPPGHAEADARAQRLRPRLLRRKPRSEALRRVAALALAIGDFAGRIDALQEAAAVPLYGVGNALDLHYID